MVWCDEFNNKKIIENFICQQRVHPNKLRMYTVEIETLQPHCTVMTKKTLCCKIQEAAKHNCKKS